MLVCRDVAQLRSELSGMRHQLAESHKQQEKWLAEMQTWRNTFAILGGVVPSAQIQAPQQTASGQRQESPVAAEGSNIMPRLAFRPDPAEIRRPCHGSSPPNGALAPRESTPQAGSTAGEEAKMHLYDQQYIAQSAQRQRVTSQPGQAQAFVPGEWLHICILSATDTGCIAMSSWLQQVRHLGSSRSAYSHLHACCCLHKSTAGVMNH